MILNISYHTNVYVLGFFEWWYEVLCKEMENLGKHKSHKYIWALNCLLFDDIIKNILQGLFCKLRAFPTKNCWCMGIAIICNGFFAPKKKGFLCERQNIK